MSEYEAATYGERIAEVYDDWYAGQDTEGAGEPFFKCQCEAHFCVPAFRFLRRPKMNLCQKVDSSDSAFAECVSSV
jgi:hypothetical protein